VGAELTFGAASPAGSSEEHPGDFFEGVGPGGARGGAGAVIEGLGPSGTERRGAPRVERLGATGLWEIASDIASTTAATGNAEAAGAPGPHSPSKKIRNHRYVARDAHGSCCAVTLAFFS
jgi:hypothetical protein